jgi:hypothetical protein
MAVQKIATANGYVTLTVTETPMFVTPQGHCDSLFVFSGFAADTSASLHWQVSADSAVQSYAVESSVNNVDFKEIGTVASSKNTTPLNAYMFTDATPATGINYYRLRKTGMDKNISYSKTVALEFAQPLRLKLYPNPATQIVTVEGLIGAKGAYVTLIGNDGKLLAETLATGNTCTFNVSNYAEGAYYINVKIGSKKATLKFVVAK